MSDCGEHYLFPCMLFTSPRPHVVTTVLGSCVAVCLYDERLRAGGMNHYMLPLWNGSGLESPKYGNIAIPRLIEELVKLGCQEKQLKAKVFGGACVLGPSGQGMNVGGRNVEMALDMLERRGIPVLASSVGQSFGRKIYFKTSTGEVRMKRVGRQ